MSELNKVWTKAEILELLETSDKAVIHGIISIYRLQTSDEQSQRTTNQKNGQGFSGADAEFGTSLAEKAIENGRLSEKQMFYARKMCKKYSGQLLRIANKEL